MTSDKDSDVFHGPVKEVKFQIVIRRRHLLESCDPRHFQWKTSRTTTTSVCHEPKEKIVDRELFGVMTTP